MASNELSLADKLKRASGDVDSDYVGQGETWSSELDEEGGYRAFTEVRQTTGRAEMINFKFKNQLQRSFEYSHLYGIDYSPADGLITLEFSEHKVFVSGVRLDHGYHRLLSHRLLQITEADTPTAKLLIHEEKEPVVMEIRVRGREVPDTNT